MDNYLYTAIVKKSKNIYKIAFPSDMIFTKDDASISDDQVEKLSKWFNIHYRAFIGSLKYLLSTRVDFIFAVHKLENISSNLGKVYFEGMVHLLR